MRGVGYMDIEKNFFKAFLKNFQEISCQLKFWDGEEIKVGNDEPKFTIILKAPLKKKDLLTSTSLAFGEAYMNGDVEIEFLIEREGQVIPVEV